MPAPVQWPAKTREMQNHHMDSTRWDGFTHRAGDIVVGTWAKSGTTWMQQILSQLIFRGDPDVISHDLAPWLELRLAPLDETLAALEAQTHRRVIKTHLPVDALTLSPVVRYLYVARDARDVAWSMHNHHAGFAPQFLDALNGVPGRVGPALEPTDLDARTYYHQWIDNDGAPFWPFWSHVQSWWDVRRLPNVKLVHFANLKADMAGEVDAIADFLGMDIDRETRERVLRHSSFDYMKANAETIAPMSRLFLKGGPRSFIHKGENGRWRDVLDTAEIAKADAQAAAHLTPDCAHWLKTGEMQQQDDN